MTFTVLDHTADTGLGLAADTLDELFASAAEGLTHCVTDLQQINARRWRKVEVKAGAIDLLLVEWLQELLYLFESEDLLFSTFELVVEPHAGGWRLTGRAGGECYAPDRHIAKLPVKAITYHQLLLTEVDGGWRGRVVFDI